MTGTETLAIVFCLMVSPLAAAGLASLNAGLGRARNAAHAMMAALCVTAVAAGMYFVCGRTFQGFAGGPGYLFLAGGKPWDWIGAAPWFFRGLGPSLAAGGGLPAAGGGLPAAGSGLPAAGSAFPAAGSAFPMLVAWFGMAAAGLAGLIPLGAASDRWRLGAILASTALLTGITFPLFAHWAWGGGFLVQIGTNYALGAGYLDPGGSGTIHALGGLTALAVTWIIGPRRGKYSPEGMPMAIPGHNAVLVLFGCMLALAGWLGLNAAGAILFAKVDLGRLPLIAVNTLFTAAAAALAAALITKIRFTKPDASLTANGWIAGLVASSASCAFVAPAEAIIIGLVAGALVPFAVELLDLRLEVDDPGGAISVHAAGGLWGMLAVGIFGRAEAGASGQLLAQTVAVAAMLGFVLPLTYGLNWLLNRVAAQRVRAEGESQGMDLSELGAGAYPEFLSHDDYR